eukprot:Tbor_TRINITY_DN6140_c1_g2::TRINITY_DN6140_c1_g2_i2::g.21764::m.21764/K08220/FLVCR, SLC49A1_2; MFS transporter, FLVCR family, feline leukemia virus subgroup C receptor-related protein
MLLCRLYNRISVFDAKRNPYVSWYRFSALIFFSLMCVSNATQWITYSVIPIKCKIFFNMTTDELNLLSTVFMFVYIGGCIFSCLGMELFGIRKCLILSSGFNFLGSFIKVVGGFPARSFTVIMIAQVFNAISQVFLLSVPPVLSNAWFGPKERPAATCISTCGVYVGIALCFLIAPRMFYDDKNADGSDDLASGFLRLFIIECAICLIPFIGILFLVPEIIGEVVGHSEAHVVSISVDSLTNQCDDISAPLNTIECSESSIGGTSGKTGDNVTRDAVAV